MVGTKQTLRGEKRAAPAFAALTNSLQMLVLRLPNPDPRRRQLSELTLDVGEISLILGEKVWRIDDVGMIHDLAGAIATLDASNHAELRRLILTINQNVQNIRNEHFPQ